MLILTGIWPDYYGFELSLVKLNSNASPMTHAHTAKHVKNSFKTILKLKKKSWKKNEKKIN